MFSLDTMIQNEGTTKEDKNETWTSQDIALNRSISQSSSSNETKEEEENMSEQKIELSVNSQTTAQTSSIDEENDNDLDIEEEKTKAIELAVTMTENTVNEISLNESVIDLPGKGHLENMNADKKYHNAEIIMEEVVEKNDVQEFPSTNEQDGVIEMNEENHDALDEMEEVLEKNDAQEFPPTHEQDGVIKMNEENDDSLDEMAVIERVQTPTNVLETLSEKDDNEVQTEMLISNKAIQTKEINDVPTAPDHNEKSKSSSDDEKATMALSGRDEIVPCSNVGSTSNSDGHKADLSQNESEDSGKKMDMIDNKMSNGITSNHDVVDGGAICDTSDTQNAVKDLNCSASEVEVEEHVISRDADDFSLSRSTDKDDLNLKFDENDVKVTNKADEEKLECVSSIPEFNGEKVSIQDESDFTLMNAGENDEYRGTSEGNEIIRSDSISIDVSSDDISSKETDVTANP